MNHLTLITAPLILTAISVLLKHFFDDADRYRLIGAELRAKYILTGKGPLSHLKNDDLDDLREYEVLQDYLRFRLVRLHFGIINFIILFGLGIVNAILAITIWIGPSTLKGDENLLFIYNYLVGPLIILMVGFSISVQYTFARQSYKTAERICNIKNWDLNGKGTFEEQCHAIICRNNIPFERIPKKISGGHSRFTDFTIGFYCCLGSFWTVVIVNFLCLLLLLFLEVPLQWFEPWVHE